MRRAIFWFAKALNGVLRRPSREESGLTAVEYEAVSLIAYEGRAAYERAREQASYCSSRGSEQGSQFWSEVALEVARRTGRTTRVQAARRTT